MNKEYAIELLEMCERHTADPKWGLCQEAFNYLERLILNHKKQSQSDNDLLNRIYKMNHKG